MLLAYRAYKKHRARKEEEAAGVQGTGTATSDAPNTNPSSPAAAVAAISDGDAPIPTPAVAGKTVPLKQYKHKVKAEEKVSLTPEQKAEKKRRTKYRWKVVFGLFAPFALQALDTTIIASALPFIAQDFHQVKQLNWIISAFNLTAAAFLPFWAQIADVFGRHWTLQSAIVLMMVGSAICTGAPTWAYGALLLGRALQGVGAAGINICVRTILADRVSLADYVVNWTIFALVAGISFSIGPVIGGYLTETSWRWCFAINLPVGAVGIPVLWILLRRDLLGPQPLAVPEGRDTSTSRGRLVSRLSTLDYGGQLLFLWGLGLVILALTWAGGTYSWGSVSVIVPLVIGGILTFAWLFYEYSMAPGHLMSRVLPYQKAMMPWELLAQRDIGLLFFINFAMGMSMFAVMYFMDLYFALVEGKPSGQAGLALLYYLPGLGAGAYMAIFSSNFWPRQSIWPLLVGGVTAAVGMTVLAWAIHAENNNVVYGMMAMIGLGVGIRMNPASLHALAYNPVMTAAISCLVSFALPFGGLVGLTIMATVFNNKSGAHDEHAKDGIMWAFISMIPFMWLCLILTTCLGNVWIGKDGAHEIVKEPYLWGLLRRKEMAKTRMLRGDALGNAAPVGTEKNGDNDVEAQPATEMAVRSPEDTSTRSTSV